MIRRFVEAGYERLSEGPESLRQFLGDLRLPKETLALILTQLEETKHGLYRAVAREVREFLERTNLTEELTQVLTQLSFEIRTEVRFVPNDAGRVGRPQVHSGVAMHRQKETRNPTAADAAQQPVDGGEEATMAPSSAPPPEQTCSEEPGSQEAGPCGKEER
jgi:hypothetical protein